MAEGALKMLIVDDEPDLNDILKETFGNEGFEVCIAEGGEKALSLLKDNQYHVVLMDICMPKLSGFDVLEQMNEKNYLVPVILMTGYCDKNNLMRALKMGVYDLFEKPFDREELTSGVRNAAATYKALIEDQEGSDSKVEAGTFDRFFKKLSKIKTQIESSQGSEE